jgi:hypothetical protein
MTTRRSDPEPGRCRGIKFNGERCQYRGADWYAGYCGHHFPWKDLVDNPREAKRWGWERILAVTAGAWTLYHPLVELTERVLSMLPIRFKRTPPRRHPVLKSEWESDRRRRGLSGARKQELLRRWRR